MEGQAAALQSVEELGWVQECVPAVSRIGAEIGMFTWVEHIANKECPDTGKLRKLRRSGMFESVEVRRLINIRPEERSLYFITSLDHAAYDGPYLGSEHQHFSSVAKQRKEFGASDRCTVRIGFPVKAVVEIHILIHISIQYCLLAFGPV